MSLLRFKVFQPIFFKTATFFSIVMSAFLYAGNAYSADVTLAWDGVSQSGVTVTGYRVYYGTQNGSYPTRGCQVADTSCTVKELKDGQTYHFVARAYNSYGESGNSDPVSYTVPDALQTFTITATAGNNGIIMPGTVSLAQGSGKTFTITANSGYEIADVVVDNNSVGAVSSYTFNGIASNHTIAANFEPVSVTVNTDNHSSDSTGNDASAGTTSNVSTTGSSSSDISSDSIADLDPSPTAIAFEAEDGIVKNSMVTDEDQNAYSGKYILIPNGVGSDGYATYTFQVTSPGNYVVWGRVLAPNSKDDSFLVSMDGGADSLWDLARSTNWVWDKVNHREGADPVVYDLEEGPHNLVIKYREDGAKLDSIVITKDLNTVPSTSIFNGDSSTTPNPSSGNSSTSVDSDKHVSTSSTSSNDTSGSSNTSASNGITTDNKNSIVSPAVTPAQEFVNQAPNRPELLFPGDGEQDVSLTPLLEIAGFTDPDAEDDHGATRWQITTDDSFEQLILDVTIDRSRTNNYLVNFLVPEGALCSGQLYYWRASVKDARDDDSKWSHWSEMFTFITTAKVQADVNGNGVADDEEPEYSDLDNDGLNDNDQPLMRVYKSRKGQSLIGINAVEGVSQINCFTSIEPESIPDEPRPKLRYGLMVFNVTLDQIGGTARFELYLPEKPRIEDKWYKYDPINGWYEFPVYIDGDKYFIEITDGGFGDADGVENGIVVDPIGLAEMSAELESVDSLDAIDSGDSESTTDRLKNACFIQVALDRPAVETTDAGTRQMVAFRFIYSGFMALVLAVAVIQVMGGRRGNRTHSSPQSKGRSRSA